MILKVQRVFQCFNNTHGDNKPCVSHKNKDDNDGGLSFKEILKKEIDKDVECEQGNE